MQPRQSTPAPLTTVTVLAALLLLSAPGAALQAQSSSDNFILQQSTTNSGGEPSDSTSYVLHASAGQELTVGTSSSVRYVLQSGFWGFVGSGLVPVILTVDKNPATPGNIDLLWSGNNSPYEVFEAGDCTDIFSHLFDTTPGNDYLDITPPGADLVCYNVLATAPGPAPPIPTP